MIQLIMIKDIIWNSEKIKEKNGLDRYKKIYQYNKCGDYLREFSSPLDIENELNINYVEVQKCCRGELKTSSGYRWSYEKVDKLPPIQYKTNAIPVIQFDKDWKFIKEWKSALEINETLNIDQSSIGRCCKGKQGTAGGYRWKYKSDCE